MKEYSDVIFNLINQIEEEIQQIKIEEIDASKIEKLKILISSTSIEELNIIDDKEFEELKKIKIIAIKLNNYEFEQYIESQKKCKEELKKILDKQERIEQQKTKIEERRKQQELLEYVYNIQIPIEEETTINKIIEKYKEKNQDPRPIIQTILEENIKYYTNKNKKQKILSAEKMKELNIEENYQYIINKAKELLSKSKNVQQDENLTDYFLNLQDEHLLEIIEEEAEYSKTTLLNIMKTLLLRINNNNKIEKSLELLNTIYETITAETIEIEENNKTKLIFVSKPTNLDLYIYDDILKIEHRVYRKILKNQFKQLINGNTQGKSLTGLPENLFEKKTSQVRITYKILPNNYILILNCYIKGNKFTENIRELIEKPNISFQIHLYDVLASENPQAISEFLNKTTNITTQETENYIKNFTESQKINILDQFEEGEKIARKIKKSS